MLTKSRPDVILLDVVLPDMSGYELCRKIRSAHPVTDGLGPDVPIIMISAKVEYTDRVRGLTRGADDYVTKPFHYPELVARIAAVQSRATRVRDRHVHKRARPGRQHAVSRRHGRWHEGLALGQGVRAAGEAGGGPRAGVLQGRVAGDRVGFPISGRTRTLDSHASRLRQKLAAHSNTEWIVNVWGVGYRLYKPE